MVSENCCGQLYVLQKEIIIMIIIIKNKEIFFGRLNKVKKMCISVKNLWQPIVH